MYQYMTQCTTINVDVSDYRLLGQLDYMHMHAISARKHTHIHLHTYTHTFTFGLGVRLGNNIDS